MSDVVAMVRDLETERAKLVNRVGKIDKALDQIKGTASAITTNGKTDKPAQIKRKKRTRRSQAEINTLKARIAAMKTEGMTVPADIHRKLIDEGLMTDNRNDYQLCVRAAKAVRSDPDRPSNPAVEDVRLTTSADTPAA